MKRAYKKAALRWFPDKNRGNTKEAELKFREVTDAYEALSDPLQRALDGVGSDDEVHAGFEESTAIVVWRAQEEKEASDKGDSEEIDLEGLLTEILNEEEAKNADAAAKAAEEAVGERVVEDALRQAPSRKGERKRQLEAKAVRDAALRPRTIPSQEEASTTAQKTMARLLAKVKPQSECTLLSDA